MEVGNPQCLLRAEKQEVGKENLGSGMQGWGARQEELERSGDTMI